MKIGFEAKRVFNNFTGLGSYSRALLSNLSDFYPDEEYILFTPNVKKNTATLPFLEEAKFDTRTSKAFLKAYWRSRGVTKELEREGLDIYHGLSHELPFNIKQSSVKSIVTIHDLIFKKFPGTYPFIDREIYDYKFKKSCQQADTIIAISESTKKDIIHFYGIDSDKIQVAYQSCNPIYYQPLKADSQAILTKYKIPKEYFLFVGSVETRKNVKLILQAYRFLPESVKIPLVIVGKATQDTKNIFALIESEGLSKLVIWIQDLSDNLHLKAIYHQAQALIYPSKYEGFGLPVVEALLSRTPVITANTSSLPEAAGPSSLLIDPTNPEDLAKAIEAIGNSQLRKEMINNGYDYAIKNFGRKVTTDVIMGIYKQTLK